MLRELPGRRSSAINLRRSESAIWMSVRETREVFYLGRNGYWVRFGSQEAFRRSYYHTKATANV